MIKRLLAVLAVAAVTFVAAPPAHTVNLGTFGFDCTVSPADLTVVADAGDTFTVDFPNCKVSGYNGQYFVYASDFPFPANMWVAPKMITMGNEVSIALRVFDPAIPAVTYNIEFRYPPTPPTSPGSVSVAETSAHPHVRQGLPMPATGSCKDIQDAEFAWGTGLTGGWERSWSTWRRENGEIFHDGPSCIRVMEHVDGVWRIADRRHY